jgi:sulfite reductase alpha subunit-like flavoprotein
MVSEIRVLHGGDIAREVARGLVSCLASRSRPTRVFEMADYLTSGFDLVDVSEAPETPLETASHAYVLVVETAEFENPADGAVTLLRDLLAANKKTKTTPRRWEVRSVENASQETTRKTASDVADASSDATETRTEPITRRVRFAVIAVGDTDVMAERAAFRSKQHCASDCNQAGQLADRLFAASGGVRIAPRLEIDVSRDAAEAQTNEWVDRTLLPALARAEG